MIVSSEVGSVKSTVHDSSLARRQFIVRLAGAFHAAFGGVEFGSKETALRGGRYE